MRQIGGVDGILEHANNFRLRCHLADTLGAALVSTLSYIS